MKRILMIVVLLGAMFAGGCLETLAPSERMEAMVQLRKLSESVDAYQEIVVDLTNQMKEDKLLTESTVIKVDEVHRA